MESSDSTVADNQDHQSTQQQVDDEERRRDSGDWPDNLVTWNGPDDPQNPMNVS
jgi:hypothetical protein